MTAKTGFSQPNQPLILRAHRLMEAFAKSDDERDFYLDRMEGFLVYVDLDKTQVELEALEKELNKNPDRYSLIPKLSFYETKKIMEGFVNEKVYDIDTKEKLLDIIQSKEARANFLEFIYDHLNELEKWQQYYQERSRIRIIEWLRTNHFHFVFEEDLELAKGIVEKLKMTMFQPKVDKDIQTGRKALESKAKIYYSNEALNPRPKRGRPPKQIVKQEVEPQVTTDIYTTVPTPVRPFLFTPDISSASSITFSASFAEQQHLTARRLQAYSDTDNSLEGLQQKLAALRSLSTKWVESDEPSEIEFEDFEEIEETAEKPLKKKAPKKTGKAITTKAAAKKPVMRPVIKPSAKQDQSQSGKKKHKRIMPVQKKVQAKSKKLTTRATKKAPPKSKPKAKRKG